MTKENDELATQIYDKLEPSFKGYLNHIHSKKDATRPGLDCGPYFFPRYWQGLVMARIKSRYTAAEEAALSSKIWKSVASVDDDSSIDSFSADDDAASVNAVVASMASTSISERPKMPSKQVSQAQPQMETPAVPRSFPTTGGTQNPPTSDETYVNTALLLLLQTLTLSMAELGKSLHNRLDFGDLDWLADRLPLKLYRRQSGGGPVELMEARVDGYLCKRDYHPHDKNGAILPRLNNLPLAIVETKPCVRSSGGTSIRWQESAEMACWVSSLRTLRATVYCSPLRAGENGKHLPLDHLLSSCQLLTGKRPRRLLLSQNRHEIYIIIAEYGEPWKEYIRTESSAEQPTARISDDAIDLSGSDAFVRNSMDRLPVEFNEMVKIAADALGKSGGRHTRAKIPLELLDPEHFCVMQQWGPFFTNNHQHMDLFLRRLIALQVQLLSTASKGPV